MRDQEIIDNAPEGATHWDCSEYMIHVHDGNWNYWSRAAGWDETKPEEETRSLADIKRIVELEDLCARAKDYLSGFEVTKYPTVMLLSEDLNEALKEPKA
jgi:hypothetical protein